MEGPGMKATEALQAARSFNVQINLCGDNLALDAPEAPPERVLDALRENKLQIVAILRASIGPAGYSDDACLAAVGDVARLGYWVVPTKPESPC
jgi:hypothetical protein